MPATRRRLETWSRTLAALVLVETLAVLALGWGLGVETLVRLSPQGAAMVPATATMLGGIAAALLLQLHGGPALRAAGRWAAGVAAVVAALRGSSIAISYLQAPPGAGDRMALATSLGLLLAGLAVFCVGGRSWLAERVVSSVGALGLTLALAGLGAWLLDRAAYDTSIVFTGMAPHTAASLVALFLAALLARRDSRLARVAFGPGAGSRAARLLLPLAVLGPLLLAELAIEIDARGLMHSSLWSTALAAALALVSTVTVLRIAALRNRQEALLRAEETRLRTALDGIDAAVFLFGRDRRLKMSNAGALRLCAGEASPEAWLFKTRFHALGDRRRLTEAERPARLLLEGRSAGDLFVGWQDRRGAEHALRFSLRRGADEEMMILSVLDETQGWILRENLTRTERLDAIGQMAGGIAHEMANIFGVARLSADTALLTGAPEAQARHLRAIQGACARGAGLTGRLLGLTRDQPDDAERFRLAPALDAFAEIARAALPASVALSVHERRQDGADAGDEAWLRVSPSDFQAALLNLAINARNAIVESGAATGRIEVLATVGETIRIAVRDDGPGMSPGVLGRAAEPFYTTRLGRGGSGLGLAMVDNFARKAGGSLQLAAAPGGGASVELTLPRAAADPAAPEAAEDAAPSLAGRRILLVEDDPAFADVSAELLLAMGAEVSRTATGEEALALVESGAAFDLLLTDVMLPGEMDGYRLATGVQAALGPTPVIYLSGYADALSRAGRDTPGLVLRKPPSATALVNTVDLALRR
ncbi:ATP-binding protein [Albimonas pacifica]|uniref:histidine kinase n=1 Tax=Albimonas pacifica TaxID=1114924 RepID=A0A1I3MYP7_9RHOB|nr:ATP-binding protein [Albimonas pacifica]SFJ02234.1 Response regulator receiver domain-containing protein [Albimonas pacifica]